MPESTCVVQLMAALTELLRDSNSNIRLKAIIKLKECIEAVGNAFNIPVPDKRECTALILALRTEFGALAGPTTCEVSKSLPVSDVLDILSAMDDTETYEWADTLFGTGGIQEWVKKHQRCTEKQAQAILNVGESNEQSWETVIYECGDSVNILEEFCASC